MYTAAVCSTEVHLPEPLPPLHPDLDLAPLQESPGSVDAEDEADVVEIFEAPAYVPELPLHLEGHLSRAGQFPHGGLVNLGNTCFVSAALQLALRSRTFRALLDPDGGINVVLRQVAAARAFVVANPTPPPRALAVGDGSVLRALRQLAIMHQLNTGAAESTPYVIAVVCAMVRASFQCRKFSRAFHVPPSDRTDKQKRRFRQEDALEFFQQLLLCVINDVSVYEVEGLYDLIAGAGRGWEQPLTRLSLLRTHGEAHLAKLQEVLPVGGAELPVDVRAGQQFSRSAFIALFGVRTIIRRPSKGATCDALSTSSLFATLDINVRRDDLTVDILRYSVAGAANLDFLHDARSCRERTVMDCGTPDTCPAAYKRHDCVSRSFIMTLPDVLVMFTLLNADRAGGYGQKYPGSIDVPTSFDAHELSFAYARDEARYDLVGVVQHQGATFESGHYIAVVLKQGRWVRYNDSNDPEALGARASPAMSTTAGRGFGQPFTPYILMYERRRA